MTASSLQNDLLEIPGIQSAELEGDLSAPSGVRVRLSAGVDAQLVGEEVRRVLAAHGLRSEVGEAAGSGVVSLTDRVPATPRPEPTEAGKPEPSPIVVAPTVEAAPRVEITATVEAAQPAGSGGLQAVAVEEGRNGVFVVARSGDGRVHRRRARSGEPGLDEAIVTAVAMLMDPEGPVPRILSAGEQAIEDTDVLTLVLDADGAVVVGSAVVEGGRPYAVGRAAWAALASS